jgi:hypothetical protein
MCEDTESICRTKLRQALVFVAGEREPNRAGGGVVTAQTHTGQGNALVYLDLTIGQFLRRHKAKVWVGTHGKAVEAEAATYRGIAQCLLFEDVDHGGRVAVENAQVERVELALVFGSLFVMSPVLLFHFSPHVLGDLIQDTVQLVHALLRLGRRSATSSGLHLAIHEEVGVGGGHPLFLVTKHAAHVFLGNVCHVHVVEAVPPASLLRLDVGCELKAVSSTPSFK